MKKTLIHISLLSSALLFSFSSTTAIAKTYYKWVDSNGSTHYTTTPPPKNAKKQGKVETYGSRTATAAQTPASPAQEQPEQQVVPNQNQAGPTTAPVAEVTPPQSAPIAAPANN